LVNAGLAAVVTEAFAIQKQLLSGSDDSIEAMSGRLGMNKCRLTTIFELRGEWRRLHRGAATDAVVP
jgi:site-specific DNA recombinase